MPDGYGKIGEGPVGGKTLNAHRLAYELYRGPIPDGMCVLHSCDTPPCVNPAHLHLGDRADNAKERDAKRRQCVGERHGQAKITEDAVRAIRAAGKLQREFAAEFGITSSAVSMIVRGVNWQTVK